MERGIVCKNLTFRYAEAGKYPVLSHAGLRIEPGTVTVLTGPSGCGKSTLLYLLAGIYPQNAGVVDEGSVWVDGQPVAQLPPFRRAPLVGMVFQNPDLQFCMDTVENELVFCMENMAVPPEEMDGKLREALDFCGIAKLGKRTFATLSGGEKQKVMLACAALIRPAWLLLDEPFANIDPAGARTLVEQLQKMRRSFGTGIVAVDHNIAPWLLIADEIVLMGEGGRVVRRGITPAGLPSCAETFQRLGIAYPGRAYREKRRAGAEAGQPVLELCGVTAGYGKEPVLRGASASFFRGKIYAVTGESGSGKSTLFSVLCRLLPYGGNIRLYGRELEKTRKRGMAHRLGFVFQNPQDQFVTGSVQEEIAMGWKNTVPEREAEQKTREYLEEIGLWRHRYLSPYMLSQGQQRRLAVAAMLAYSCDVLVCDEPTYAQDARALRTVMKLLQERVERQGLTLIFSTHDMQLAHDYADVVLRLSNGKLERREHAEDQSNV